MPQDIGPRLIAAVIATVALMAALGWYLGNRDKIVAGADKEVRGYLDDYAANHSMISRDAPANAPVESRFEIVWRCGDGPAYALVRYGISADDATARTRKTHRLKKCDILKVEPTTKPVCPTRDTCGVARIVAK